MSHEKQCSQSKPIKREQEPSPLTNTLGNQLSSVSEVQAKQLADNFMVEHDVRTLEEEAMRFFNRAAVAEEPSLEEQLRNALALAEERRLTSLHAVEEMQNFRKRYERDSAANRQFAIEGFARDLLLVADNLERALAAIPEGCSDELRTLQEGVILIQGELNRSFEKHGVHRVHALHQPFDPNIHQAVLHVTDSQVEAGLVIQEMQAGYLLNGRLLRPAMVGVCKEKESEEKK